MSIGELVNKLRRDGKSVIDLSWGEPRFETYRGIKNSAVQALEEDKTHYTNSRGIPELREAISRKLKQMNNLDYNPEKEIIVTPGAKQAIFYAISSLIEKGDEVILFEPYWLSYRDIVKIAEGKAVEVRSTVENKFKPTYDDIIEKITDKSKAIVINTPSNPTGMVWEKRDLEMIKDIAIEHNLIVIADEVYEDIIFDGRKHFSIASFPGMRDRTISVYSFSKSFVMTGWRIGYMAGPAEIMEHIIKVHQHTATCANSISQHAALYALENERENVISLREKLQRCRDIIFEGIQANDKLFTLKPEGAFYSWVDITKLGMDSKTASEHLLKNFGLATVPGTAYGSSGEGYIRLSFALPEEEIAKAAEILQKL
jgi:aspartate/methionine/tyrosine aminotransferase